MIKALLNRAAQRLYLGRLLSKTVLDHFPPGFPPISPEQSEGGKASSSPVKERFHWSPWKPIPSTMGMKLGDAEFDRLLLEIGILKKEGRRKVFEKGPNRKLVKYAQCQIKRIRWEVKCGRIENAWKLGKFLMKRSIVFNLMALSQCYPLWYKRESVRFFHTVIYRAMRLAETNNHNLEYARVYIDKAGGKKRPLGVPTPAWRVYLCLMNWILFELSRHSMPDFQHGYRPRRGVLTAWREIFLKALKHKHIFEFDLKGFFDNIPINRALNMELREGVYPEELVDELKELATCVPRLGKVDQIDESANREPMLTGSYKANVNWPEPTYTIQYFMDTSAFGDIQPWQKDMFRKLGWNAANYPPQLLKPEWIRPGWIRYHWLKPQPDLDLQPNWGVPTMADITIFRLTKDGDKVELDMMVRTPSGWQYMDAPIVPNEEFFSLFEEEILDKPLEIIKPVVEPLHPLLKQRGFPQGAAISPLLSTQYLRFLVLPKGVFLIMYADDGILYSNREITMEEVVEIFKSLDLEVNIEKSGPVKGSLRFLGIRLDQSGLWSDTRSGTKMLMNGPESFNWVLAQKAIQAELESWDKEQVDYENPYGGLAQGEDLVNQSVAPEELFDMKLHGDELYQEISEHMRTYERFPRDRTVDVEETISRQLWGFLISRLYLGEINPRVYSERELVGENDSLLPLLKQCRATLDNASSIAWDWAVRSLRRHRRIRVANRLLREGKVTWQWWVNHRREMGLMIPDKKYRWQDGQLYLDLNYFGS